MMSSWSRTAGDTYAANCFKYDTICSVEISLLPKASVKAVMFAEASVETIRIRKF